MWARKLTDLDPSDPDAHYALAAHELEVTSDVAAAARELEVLEAREPERLRTEWVRAALAVHRGDVAALGAVLGRIRGAELAAGADSTDRIAQLKLRQIDATNTTEPAGLLAKVPVFCGRGDRHRGGQDAGTAAPGHGRAAGEPASGASDPGAERRWRILGVSRSWVVRSESLEVVAEAGFQGALKALRRRT